MLKKLLGLLAILLVVFLVAAAMQPEDFRVTRSTTISAPSSALYAIVNDSHKWDAWSPWSKLDPAMKTSFEGPPTGVGAVYAWSGNSEVGEGKSTIVESIPNEKVALKLEFIRPFAGVNDVEFLLKPVGDQTTISWTMSGKKNFIAKALGLVMNCDKMVGGQFEQGLANLKTLAEGTK